MEKPPASLSPDDGQSDSPKYKDADTQEKSSRNWRPILQFLGAYLVGAWTLLQFIDWFCARNQISPYWVDLFLWIFVGLLPAIIFYLFYKERLEQFGSNRKDKLFLTGNLIILILVLFFSFRNTDLGATTKEITFVDANGISQNKTITKREFRKKVVVFDFEPQGVDSNHLWLTTGISSLLALDAQQDKAFLVSQIGGETPMASKINYSEIDDFFVDGQYRFDGVQYEISPRVFNAKNGQLLQQTSFVGEDFLALIDSISLYVRRQSGVAPSLIEASTDLPIESFTSSSLPALASFFKGGYANTERAILLDSTFAYASYVLGTKLYGSDISDLDTKFYLDQAFRHRGKLPFDMQNALLAYRYLAYQDLEAAEKMLQLQLDIDPGSDALNLAMVKVYSNSGRLDKLLEFTTAWSERDLYASAVEYGNALQLNLASDVILKGVKPFTLLYPNNEFLQTATFKAHFIDRNWEAAAKALEKIKLTNPQYAPTIELIEASIDYQKSNPDVSVDQYADFVGINRFYSSERISYISPHPKRSDLLLAQVPNGLILFFPFSEDQLIQLRPTYLGGVSLHEMLKDSSGRVYAMQTESYSYNRSQPRLYFQWRIDSMVLRAEKLLFERDYEQAEAAYEAAINRHPNLYFLRDALQHIQYVKSKTPAELQRQLASVTGQYGERKFWLKGGRLFYKRAPTEAQYFPKMQLFPISATRYISFSRQHIQLEFAYKNDRATASYSHVYDRDSARWQRNDIEEDYKVRSVDQ